MTIHEQVVLATDKVAHWNSKRDHATAMLTKWQTRLSAMQSKGKPEPTAKKLPPVTLVPGTEDCLARESALRDIAEEAGDSGDKVVPLKGKVAKANRPKKR